MNQRPPTQEETLEGTVQRVVFHSPEDGYTVINLAPAAGGEHVAAVGSLSDPIPGECVRLFGRWVRDKRYGRQFRFESHQLVRPSSTDAIIGYLSGGAVEGIGEVMARRLVQHFGERTLEVLDEKPERLTEVEGIGRVRAARIAQAWQRQERMRDVMLFLQEHGITGATAAKIYAAFGDQAIEVVERDPYVLARRIRGIGFATADRIARSVGIDPRDPSRLQAGMVYCLHEAGSEGHLFLPAARLFEQASELMHVPVEPLEPALRQLHEAEEVTVEEAPGTPAVYLPHLLKAEQEVAAHVLALVARQVEGAPSRDHTRRWMRRQRDLAGLQLSEQQIEAICAALIEGVSIITGGPGTGKTTLARVLVRACKALGRRIALAAPTGRAAKRMGELAGEDASTIHRLLAYDPAAGHFTYHQDRPLPVDTLIVDESSMVDLLLARDLLRAIPRQAQLILIGDADQLPSVGPGNFLRDLVNSGAVPVQRLTEIFRQAEESLIVANAHSLIRGQQPRLVPWRERRAEDCLFVGSREADKAADLVIRAVTRELPRLGYQADQIQVITPMHRGPLGVVELNRRLQESLNPPASRKPELSVGDHVFRQGDRVLQVVNNYDKAVYNGEIGRIIRVHADDKQLVVGFEDVRVAYEFSELDQLQLAYAMTIHKSQGSEYPVAVIAMHSTHYIMLRRNLLYTALTRAQELAVIVGNYPGVMRAAENADEMERHTRLAERLRGEAAVASRRGALPL
jgi:exodeoxyribonuclease V alpha subunit